MGTGWKRWLRQRYFQAAVGGLLLALAYPHPEVAGLAWVAPGLWLVASAGCRPGEAFRVGYVGGLVFWGVSLYWLLLIPVNFFPILGWLALCSYLSLYQGVWTWACVRLSPAANTLAGEGGMAQERGMATMLALPRINRAAWVLAAAVVWVALEMVRARFLTGFPWNLLGVSQYTLLPVVQLAQVTGVYGVSFLVIWTGVALVVAAAGLARYPWRKGWLAGELAAPAAVMLLVWFWGVRECQRKMAAPAAPVLRMALVQPSVPQTLIWNPQENETRLGRLVELSRAALSSRPDVLVWPEAAAPGMLRYDSNLWAAVNGLAQTGKVWMVVGSDDAEPDGQGGARYYNAVFLLSPQGELVDRYCKRHLVMFGEYVPGAKWLPFLGRLLPAGEGFTPGQEAAHFEWRLNPEGGVRVRAAMTICFEDVLPALVRRSVDRDTDFILNLTNDGWFRQSAAQYQHAANAVFRAVETGRPVVRCTNNGRTCWVDAAGRIGEMESHWLEEGSSIYGESWHLVRLPLPLAGVGNGTVYMRYGDWFGWVCVGAAGGMLGWTWRRQKGCRLPGTGFME